MAAKQTCEIIMILITTTTTTTTTTVKQTSATTITTAKQEKYQGPKGMAQKKFFRKLFKSIEWIKISKIPGNYLSKINTRTVRENIPRERLG